MGKRHYDVVCGILIDKQNRILVTLRNFAADQGGLWEFPGGKVEVDEEMFDALCRELAEELGIEVKQADPWLQVDHEYPRYHVTLYAWKVIEFSGEPQPKEGQHMQWMRIEDLPLLQFPEANDPIVNELVFAKPETGVSDK